MYDYVIVGAGTAGCVLAARLSEDPGVSVCLIEAGPSDTSEDIGVPIAFGNLFRTRLDWDYDTHDEPNLNDRRIYLPRGRVVGGTSSMNTMVYIRGNKADFDDWRQPGWGYHDLLPYFTRSEDNQRGKSPYHGVGGPLTVSDGRANNPMASAFVAAAVEAGFAANDDFNGAEQDGFGYFQLTQRDGRRASAATAFLHPVMDRPNLTVETELQIAQVMTDHGRAVGVRGLRLDEEVAIQAAREVVVCGGAYNSPQLLMLSGIGPADQLTRLGIDVVVDLPQVGGNLQDHVLVPLVFTHSQPVSLLAAGSPEHVRQFVEEGRGPLTANGPESGGFVRVASGVPAPDVEFLALPIQLVDSGLGTPTEHAISFGPAMLTPQSRGRVELVSENPTAKPRILHNYFSEPPDLDTTVAALRIGLELAKQDALKLYTEQRFRPPESDSDADLRAYARRYGHSIHHAVGTCAIGQVVDHDLKVLGVDGLRVVDASVIPAIVRGHPMAPTIAIAEKAADLVKSGRS